MTALWMPTVLRAAGLSVVEYPGWQLRGRPGALNPRAIMWHHDASSEGPSYYMARYIAEVGRPPEAPAPLANLWVNALGKWHVLAAGKANHAGQGSGWGVIPEDYGNETSIGVEVDHTTNERWYPQQINSLRRGTAALMRYLGAKPQNALCGHKEYARGRKTDPDLDMNAERAKVAALITPEDDVPLTQDEINRIAAAVWAYTVAGDEDGSDGRLLSASKTLSRAYSQSRKARILSGQAAVDDARGAFPPTGVPSEDDSLYGKS